MMLLAIDTATKLMGLALFDGHTLLAEQNWWTGRRQNELLAPTLQPMLTACHTPLAAITHLAVAKGPGSYTGLRIGVAFAKGLAAAHNLPLIGVPTLDILAAGQPFTSGRQRLLAVIEAGRGRIIAGEYRLKKGRWEADGEPQITDWDEVLPTLTEPYLLCGEIDAKGREAIETQRRTRDIPLWIAPVAQRGRRAGLLAVEAWRLFEEGDPDAFAPQHLLPIYLSAADSSS